MKTIFFALISLVFANAAFAQKELLSFNEQNKYIYYQVVDQPGLVTDSLQARAAFFLSSAYPKNKVNKGEPMGTFAGSGSFLVTNGTLVKHVDGEISYSFFIECKDQKYRYWLTDFVFTPYKTDRYGNSVPEVGINVPLESGASKLDKGQLNTYLDQAGSLSKQFGDRLKQYIVKVSALPKNEKKKVINTKDW
jgi:hypothetical protein